MGYVLVTEEYLAEISLGTNSRTLQQLRRLLRACTALGHQLLYNERMQVGKASCGGVEMMILLDAVSLPTVCEVMEYLAKTKGIELSPPKTLKAPEVSTEKPLRPPEAVASSIGLASVKSSQEAKAPKTLEPEPAMDEPEAAPSRGVAPEPEVASGQTLAPEPEPDENLASQPQLEPEQMPPKEEANGEAARPANEPKLTPEQMLAQLGRRAEQMNGYIEQRGDMAVYYRNHDFDDSQAFRPGLFRHGRGEFKIPDGLNDLARVITDDEELWSFAGW